MKARQLRQWFNFQNATADPSIVDIHVIDIIGDWVDELINEYYGVKATITAKAFVDQLAQLADSVKTIRVHINSPGGDVFAAVNIANALREQQTSKARTVETVVDGIAASAASIIMMAGTTVRIADNAMVMVHKPWSGQIGNAADMRKAADTLDAIQNTIVATYKWHSSLETDALNALVDAETWMDADTALANGFATEKVAGLQAAASIDHRVAGALKVPDQFKARVQALLKPSPAEPTVATAAQVLDACDAAGCLDLAKGLVAQNLTLEQLNARVTDEKTKRATASARAEEIRVLCDTAKHPDLAEGYVNGQMSVADVRVHLSTINAKIDKKIEIDGSLSVDGRNARSSSAKSDLDAAYAKLNQPAQR